MIDHTFLDASSDDDIALSKKKVDEIVVSRDDCVDTAESDRLRLKELSQSLDGDVWKDPDFPANAKSIKGKDDDTKPASTICKCGLSVGRAVVKSATPNKGRAYFYCAQRTCGYFAWAEGGAKYSPKWQRFVNAKLVSDSGFAAGDLSQGRLGSCWFLSALAVVAERYDLIHRLFIDTAPNPQGIYGVRFFLDGKWETVFVDDRLPTIEDRPAFARCYDTSGLAKSTPTLWASITEKAYAKAHGSYQAISGGQISEALRDLTGAACIAIDLSTNSSFDFLDTLWPSLLHWKNYPNEFPMGCATSAKIENLNPSHAYSILAVKQYPEGRILRIRDPHGTSQFPKIDALGKQIAQRLLSSSHAHLDKDDRALIQEAMHPSGADGTFFIPYHHFAAAFTRIDVCLAWKPGLLCAASLRCRFPKRKTAASRLCEAPVLLQNLDESKSGQIALVALQDTKRGAWCRDDRKKSYAPGDVSLIVFDRDQRPRVLASCFQGCEVGEHAVSCVFTLPPKASCIVLCFSFVKNPTATTGSTLLDQPLMLRCTADVKLRLVPPGLQSSKHATAALHAAILHSGAYTIIERPRSLRTLKPADGLICKSLISDGLLLLLGINTRQESVLLDAVCYCKSAAARASDGGGLLVDDVPAAKQYAENLVKTSQSTPQSAYKWPAKWKCFRAPGIRIPPNTQRILMAVACTGVQFKIGDFSVSLSSSSDRGLIQTTLSGSTSLGVFGPVPIAKRVDTHLERALRDSRHDNDLQRAIDLSRSDEDEDFLRAIELSKKEEQAKTQADVILIDETLPTRRRRPLEPIVIDDDVSLPSPKKARKAPSPSEIIIIDDDDDDDDDNFSEHVGDPAPPHNLQSDVSGAKTTSGIEAPVPSDTNSNDDESPLSNEERRTAQLAALEKRGLLF